MPGKSQVRYYMVEFIRGSRKFCQRVSNSDNVFIRGETIQILLKTGHQRPARETPFKWRFSVGPMMAQYSMLAW